MSLTADAAPLVILIVGIISAVLGAIALLVLFRVAVFIVGAVLGYSLTLALLASLSVPGNALLYALIGAVVFGVLALLLNQYFIFIITAFSGASAILTGVSLILTGDQALEAFRQREAIAAAFDNPPVLVGVIWLLLALSGIVIQYRGRHGNNLQQYCCNRRVRCEKLRKNRRCIRQIAGRVRVET